jgi:hypothetical protein
MLQIVSWTWVRVVRTYLLFGDGVSHSQHDFNDHHEDGNNNNNNIIAFKIS